MVTHFLSPSSSPMKRPKLISGRTDPTMNGWLCRRSSTQCSVFLCGLEHKRRPGLNGWRYLSNLKNISINCGQVCIHKVRNSFCNQGSISVRPASTDSVELWVVYSPRTVSAFTFSFIMICFIIFMMPPLTARPRITGCIVKLGVNHHGSLCCTPKLPGKRYWPPTNQSVCWKM